MGAVDPYTTLGKGEGRDPGLVYTTPPRAPPLVSTKICGARSTPQILVYTRGGGPGGGRIHQARGATLTLA